MLQPDFSLEDQFNSLCIGVDEVGCGSWAGPVVAAAVMIERAYADYSLFPYVRDSKQLSVKKREDLYERIFQDPYIQFGLAEANVEEIDQFNITQATQLAMKRAVEFLRSPSYIPVLVDGIRKPNLLHPIQTIIKGDQKSLSIAIASILAKVTRDRLMKKLHIQFPHYGWDKNVGYGTAFHQKTIKDYGISPYHRKNFKPIKVFLRDI